MSNEVRPFIMPSAWGSHKVDSPFIVSLSNEVRPFIMPSA